MLPRDARVDTGKKICTIENRSVRAFQEGGFTARHGAVCFFLGGEVHMPI